MLSSQLPLQEIAPPSSCTLQQVEKWNLSETRGDSSSTENQLGWQDFDEEESYNKVVSAV